jgi:hypothetical protein
MKNVITLTNIKTCGLQRPNLWVYYQYSKGHGYQSIYVRNLLEWNNLKGKPNIKNTNLNKNKKELHGQILNLLDDKIWYEDVYTSQFS